MKYANGFTLLEILVVLTIFGVVFSISVAWLHHLENVNFKKNIKHLKNIISFLELKTALTGKTAIIEVEPNCRYIEIKLGKKIWKREFKDIKCFVVSENKKEPLEDRLTFVISSGSIDMPVLEFRKGKISLKLNPLILYPFKKVNNG